jgi:hypothetical protein
MEVFFLFFLFFWGGDDKSDWLDLNEECKVKRAKLVASSDEKQKVWKRNLTIVFKIQRFNNFYSQVLNKNEFLIEKRLIISATIN